jgi:formate C-acetyltransferase
LIEVRERVLNTVDARFDSGKHMSCHVVRSLHYTTGRRIDASADGRLSGEPVADSIGAQTGTAKNGPTGVLNSVANLDLAHHYRGGTNLNVTLPATQLQSSEMQQNVLSMIEAFFDNGGQQLQLASLNVVVLRDAVAHPQHYRDLVVRVAGFNARFIDLSRIEQEEIIKRAEVAAST